MPKDFDMKQVQPSHCEQRQSRWTPSKPEVVQIGPILNQHLRSRENDETEL